MRISRDFLLGGLTAMLLTAAVGFVRYPDPEPARGAQATGMQLSCTAEMCVVVYADGRSYRIHPRANSQRWHSLTGLPSR